MVQTPFSKESSIDLDSLDRLLEYAVSGGVAGLLVPVVASEVDQLSLEEKTALVRRVARIVEGRVQLIVGASSHSAEETRAMIRLAETVEATAYLVAVPGTLPEDDLVDYFGRVAEASTMPLIIQDLDWTGSGLSLQRIEQLRESLPTLQGLKIETVPAGPKYTAVRKLCGSDFYIAGGWAVPQLIEALDRRVDAMIPESSMVPVYSEIYRRYVSGDRSGALDLFRKLLPILVFSNQEIALSIAFFKRLLARKQIFSTERMRLSGFEWDRFNSTIAEELIDLYFDLESEVSR